LACYERAELGAPNRALPDLCWEATVMPKSLLRRLLAAVALVVGIGAASASVSAADAAAPATAASAAPAAAQQSAVMKPADWFW